MGDGSPVAAPMFALYLQDVGDRSKSRHAVKEALNAVSWIQPFEQINW